MDWETARQVTAANRKIAEQFLTGESRQAWEGWKGTLPLLQKALLQMLGEGLAEEGAVVAVLRDIMESIENTDEVLLADVLLYGVGPLLEGAMPAAEGQAV